MDKPTVLYVDDEKYNLITFKAVFRDHFQIYTSTTTADAIKLIQEHQPKVIISDYKIPEMNGIDFLKQAHEIYPAAGLILSSGLVEPFDEEAGYTIHMMPKPWDEDKLVEMILSLC